MEGHGEVEVNLARYFNADTRNVPFGPVLSWVSEEGRNKSPFTITGHCPPFWPPDFGDNFENVIKLGPWCYHFLTPWGLYDIPNDLGIISTFTY